jgi:hypothetical protein
MTPPAVSLTAPVDGEKSDAVIPSCRRYLVIWFIAVVALVGLIGAFDALIDPFLVIGAPRIAGLSAAKPETTTHTQLAKDYLFARMRPVGLLLGSSKVDLGMDPESRFWPENARPAFDYGVPGAGLRDELADLRRAVGLGTVRRVLVVLDIQEFMKPPSAVEPALLAARTWVQHVRDIVLATLSLDALRASIATVIAQRQPHPIDLSPDGATNDQGFRNEVETDGYETLFVQKEMENTKYLARLAASLRAHPDAGIANLDQVADIIAICRRHRIALDFAVAPLHSDLLTQIDRAGLWPRYQRAKAALTRLITPKGGGAVRLWDFSGFDAVSTEPVPTRAEHSAETRWFWEPGHFKRALGDKILTAIYGGAPGYGVLLAPGTIAAHLATETAARDAWMAGDSGEWRERLARAAMR